MRMDARRIGVPRGLAVSVDLPVEPDELVPMTCAPRANRVVYRAEPLMGPEMHRGRNQACSGSFRLLLPLIFWRSAFSLRTATFEEVLRPVEGRVLGAELGERVGFHRIDVVVRGG